jgi:CubicO group peptidase (beta-lactamase class C family)
MWEKPMRMKPLLWGIVVALAVLPAAGQSSVKRLDGSTISSAEIDAAVTRLMSGAEVTGAAIAIFNDGKVAYLKAYGFRDTEKNLPLTVDSVMTAASFSKVAFAYLVMQLVEGGKLDLDKPVYQYFPKLLPEYPSYRDLATDPRYQKITARMLLSHTSGFPNFRWMNDDKKLNINFDPGSRFAYSGEGIELLQFVVETITHKPLQELMQAQVFQPLGMTRTSMVWEDRFESDYANGYDEYSRSIGPERRSSADAAGSMQTTPRDFAQFMLAVMNSKGMQPKTRELMLSPQIQILAKHEFPTMENIASDENKAIRLSYGLGWGLYWTPPYGKAFFKEGHDVGWRNYTVAFDKPKTGLLIMTNSANGEGMFEELLETLLRNPYTPIEWERFTPYNKLPPRPPLKMHKQITVDPKVLERYVGRYGTPPDLILVIRREGDHLSVQENDEPKQELFGETDRDFFAKVDDDTYTFEVDGQGRITSMTLHVDGKDIPLKRID